MLLDFDYEPLPLIDLRIVFTETKILHGDYELNNSFFENEKLHNIQIEINYNKKDKDIIVGLISHELNHINEYYKIHLKMLRTNVKIKPTWIDIQLAFKDLNISKEHNYYSFIYLLYLSLDTEMNARISQVYDYLLSFNILDESILFDKLKKHKNWAFVELLRNFDYKKFVDINLNNIGLSGLLTITNDLIFKFKNKDLNKRTKLLKFISDDVHNVQELYSFYENFSEYFSIKTIKHIEHFKYLIKEVIEDLNQNRPYNESCRVNKIVKFD